MADQQEKTESAISVIVAGDSAFGRAMAKCFPEGQGFVLVRCPDAVSEALCCCRKMTPCALLVEKSFLEEVEPDELANLVGFGRSVQVLVRLPAEEPSAYLENLLRMGCMGYFWGGASPSTLRRAVRAVASGELWASRKLISRLIQRLFLAESPRRLTRREAAILNLISKGYKNREIAEKLFISRQTVRWHMRSLYSKIGVQDRLSAAFHALERDQTVAPPSSPEPSKKHPEQERTPYPIKNPVRQT